MRRVWVAVLNCKEDQYSNGPIASSDNKESLKTHLGTIFENPQWIQNPYPFAHTIHPDEWSEVHPFTNPAKKYRVEIYSVHFC